jgi:hypothetical protein
MRIVKARKLHDCKKCPNSINCNDFYYPQRRGKAICFDCGRVKKETSTFIQRLLSWLK